MKTIDFFKFLDNKYPTTLHSTVGYLERNRHTYVESNTLSSVSDLNALKACSGLHKSKRIVLLSALKVIKLREEAELAYKYKQELYKLEKPNLSMIQLVVDTNDLYVLNELIKYSILSSAGRLAQLKVEYPKVFKSLIEALDYFGSKNKVLLKNVNTIVNSDLFNTAFNNLKLLKEV